VLDNIIALVQTLNTATNTLSIFGVYVTGSDPNFDEATPYYTCTVSSTTS
jgi:hypothetical protein